MIALILTIAIVVSMAWLIRYLGGLGQVWGFFPANTFVLITTKANENTEADAVSGGVSDILHNVPGHRLNKDSENPMEWEFVLGEEDRGFLYHTLGVEYLGGPPFTRFLRLNKIHQIRYAHKDDGKKDDGTEDGGTEYVPTWKNYTTKFPHFSGNLTVLVEKAETAGIFGLYINFNLNYERVQPLKSILRVPDMYAVLTQMVRGAVIAVTGAHQPESFIKGTKGIDGIEDKSAKEFQEELVAAVEAISDLAKKELGIRITKATLESIDPDPKIVATLELEEKTKRENAALVAVAKANADAKILDNEADAHRVQNVTLPQANAPGAAAIRFAEAYEANKTVTVFAPGGSLSQILPDLSTSQKQKATQEPEEAGTKK